MKNDDVLTSEAVAVCEAAWIALSGPVSIDASSEFMAWSSQLLEKLAKKETTAEAVKLPLLLCTIAGLSTFEELVELEKLKHAADIAFRGLEKVNLNDEERAALESIILHILRRNFSPSMLTNREANISYDASKLRPELARYVASYYSSRGGREKLR